MTIDMNRFRTKVSLHFVLNCIGRYVRIADKRKTLKFCPNGSYDFVPHLLDSDRICSNRTVFFNNLLLSIILS